MKYSLLCFKIFDRLIISFTKHDYYVSTSFMQENKRYKGLKTGKWISIWWLVPGLCSRSDQLDLRHTFLLLEVVKN